MPTQADFQGWQQQRIANGEDPNDYGAWVTHATTVWGDPSITGGGGGSTGGTGAGSYQTPNGPRTIDQIRSELQAAGYGGPWDEGSMIAAYSRTAGGGGGGGGGYGGGGGGYGSLGDLINSALYGNTQNFELTKRQIEAEIADMEARLKLAQNADERERLLVQLEERRTELAFLQFAEGQYQFRQGQEQQNDQFNRALYGDLGSALLSAAVQLSSQPKDWLKYAEYTNGGRDIFSSLFGNTPAPAFGASGYSDPNSVTDVLQKLGILPGTFPGGGGTVPDPSRQLPDQARSGQPTSPPSPVGGTMPPGGTAPTNPADAGRLAQSAQTATTAAAPPNPAGTVAAAPTTMAGVGASNVAPDPMQYLLSTAIAPNDADMGRPPAAPASPTQPTAPANPGADQARPPAQSTPPNPYQMQGNPWQINPLVWDSYTDDAKAMILGAAERGYTPTGVWRAADFVRNIDAARPKGYAPRQTRTVWQTPAGF